MFRWLGDWFEGLGVRTTGMVSIPRSLGDTGLWILVTRQDIGQDAKRMNLLYGLQPLLVVSNLVSLRVNI
jgi:hypothetical protein